MSSEIELRDFIRQTLVQIALGVRSANEELHKEHGGKYSMHLIAFTVIWVIANHCQAYPSMLQ